MRCLLLPAAICLAGCHAATRSNAEHAAPVIEVPADDCRIVVYARYTPHPEADSSGSQFEPFVDAFQVERVVHGTFPNAEIRVHRHGAAAPEYPHDLQNGKKYLLEIKPTPHLKQELSRYGDDTIDWLSIDADEIASANAE